MKLSIRGVIGAVFILAMCALFVRLGFWQLERLGERRARNAAIEAATALPPVTLNAVGFDSIRRYPRRLVNRRARATGLFIPSSDVLLRGRTLDGQPGVHVVTPLGSPDGTVLVNRGWVPAPDAATPASVPRPDTMIVTVEGVLQAVPTTTNGGEPSRGANGITTYRRLDLPTMRARHGPALPALYLQITPDPAVSVQPSPVPVALPARSEGNHLSYAVQWFSFAAIGVVGLAILLFRGRRSGG